ncbi:MAG: zf-HC2 domain-containing protein [Anaerolineales bacterium]|nr:zf-HC2 domain-containing protein [Anaerolineales bacterium]
MEHEECRHLLGELSEYIDGTLEAKLCAEIERHLSECERCRVVVDTLHKTVYLVQSTASEVQAPQEVRQRLFKRLDLDDFIQE